MTRQQFSALVALVCLLGAVGLRAQSGSASDATSGAGSTVVPRLIKFSGGLNPQITQITQTSENQSEKKPLPTMVGLTFSLYELQEGGSPLWSEAQEVQVDDRGRYTVLLGTTQPEGLPLDLFTSGKALWLGVQPQLPGAVEQPRVLLVAVPYALKAADSDTLGGLPASAFLTTESPAGAPTQVAGGAKGAAGSWIITGKGTPNYVPLWTSSSALGNSVLFQNGGKIGIGTTTPAARLEVDGTTKFDQPVTFASGQTFTGDGSGLTNVNAAKLGGLLPSAFQPAGAYATLGANTFTGNQNVTGNVVATGNLTGVQGNFSGTTTAPSFTAPTLTTRSAGESLAISAQSGTGNGGGVTISAGAAGVTNGGAGGNVTLQAGGSMPQGGSGYGNLGPAGGVSVTAGSGYNEVGGDVDVTSGLSSPWAQPNLFSKIHLKGGELFTGDGASLDVEGGHSASVGSNVSAGGNVHITGGSSTTGYAGGNIILTPGTGTPNGNVGIGTTTPGAGLEVNGTAKFDSSVTVTSLTAGDCVQAGAGGLLTTTASACGGGGGGGTVTSVGSGAGLTGGPITTSGTLSVATGGVTNTMLANPSLTVTAGTGLSGGGSVALGGSTSLSIPSGGVTNAMLANPSLTVAAGTDLTGGGAVALGGSVTLNLDITKVPTLAASSNVFSGSVNATSFWGDGTNVTNVNAAKLGGLLPSAFQPAGAYATLGANTFGATQTISSGNLSLSNGTLNLPATTGATVGVINLGAAPFIHACCYDSMFGYTNTFVGLSAGNFATTGNFNTASGEAALKSNTTGWQNTASGNGALELNTAGSGNTASGVGALVGNTTGNNNTASGYAALGLNTTGSDNTAVGQSAGYYYSGTASLPTTGSNSTFVGAQATATLDGLINATAIGYNAQVAESNALVLGAPGVNVGIGTASPIATLQINENNAQNADTLLIGNNSTKGLALFDYGSGVDIESFGVPLNINYAGNHYTLLNTVGSATGYVGIGTSSPDNMLTVNGSADKPSGGSWGTFSDARLKTVGKNFRAGLPEVLKLNPIYYRYKEKNALGITDRDEHVGFVAQEVEKVIPEAVTKDSRGYRIVNNDPILWAMLNAIKQQQGLIQKQAEEIKAQQEQIAQLVSQTRVIQAALAGKGAAQPQVRAAKNSAVAAKRPKTPRPNTKDAVNPLLAKVRF